MNQLVDRLLDLPPRQRMLLVVTMFVGVVFFYLSWFYWPVSSQVREKREMVADLTVRLDREKQMVTNLDEMRRVVAELNAALLEATSQLPDGKEIPDLLSNVSSLGRESGLEILVFRQGPERFQEFYAEVPVEIRAAGSYHQFGSFFDKVGRLSRIVNVSDIKMREGASSGEPVTIDAACAVTTYRFLDESERERIAKEKEREGSG